MRKPGAPRIWSNEDGHTFLSFYFMHGGICMHVPLEREDLEGMRDDIKNELESMDENAL
jgi:hypothetical protein